jgi:hypothetical protein
MQTKLEIIERAKDEIRSDVMAGVIPGNTYNFEDLHYFVDANDYGGFTRENFTADWDFISQVQAELNAWMAETGIDLEESN